MFGTFRSSRWTVSKDNHMEVMSTDTDIDMTSSVATNSTDGIHDTNIRATKRKLDDAFEILDSVVISPSTENSIQPPLKRANTSRSLYSTLAKYGIKSKDTKKSEDVQLKNMPKNTPHLTAILTRAASRTKNVFPFKFSSQTHSAPLLSATADYRPSSLPSFLSRLATFKLATYANKPPAVDAVAASKCGWINDGKDRLVCGFCGASWVVSGREGLNRDAANALVEKQRISLVEAHKNGCPWKTRQCDPSIYCIPLRSPAALVKEIKSIAIILESFLEGVAVKHPLSQSQLNALRSTVSTYSLGESKGTETKDMDVSDSLPLPVVEPSDTAILTSLFGWALVPPVNSSTTRRALSTSRASSAVPSNPATPSLSRASSVSLTRAERSPPRPFAFRLPSTLIHKKENTVLQCTLCQRRIGLWAFTPQPTRNETISQPSSEGETETLVTQNTTVNPQRHFDLLREHRSYCPYVVRSTFIPSLPVPQSVDSTNREGLTRSNSSLAHLNGPPGALEGWRAALTVTLRHGMAQRQRMQFNFMTSESTEEEGEPMEVDGVKAMIAGVKSHGGKDLLKYVKNLLG